MTDKIPTSSVEVTIVKTEMVGRAVASCYVRCDVSCQRLVDLEEVDVESI